MVNQKMQHLGEERSAIRELFEQGKILKEKYGTSNVFDFSIGNPSVPAPPIVANTLTNILKGDTLSLHRYTSAQGDKSVRQSISSYISKTYNTDIDADLIYLTVGAAAGLAISIRALITSENDEVLLFAPFFPEYNVFIENAGANQSIVEPDYKTFKPNLSDLQSKINKNTKIVIINSPNNPTGVVYGEDTIKGICDILSLREKEFGHPIYIISDEPYRELIYNGISYPFITNYYDNSIVTYSFSKSLSLPGERIGYIIVNPNCQDKNSVYAAICGAGRSLGYVCAPSLFQFMIPQVLGSTSDIQIYKRNSEIFYQELTNIGYEVIKPDGAFYLFVKALEDNDENFSKKALEYNLLIVPSKSFGVKGYVRIAYCVEEQQIINSIPEFKKLYEYYQRNIL